MSKEAKKATWTNYGDVNPLEHGGLWIKKDTEIKSDTCYYVVKVDKVEDFENTWLYNEGYVDISDTWIKWEDIKNSCDTPSDATDERKVIDAIWYYGLVEFGGMEELKEGRKAIREAINANGIVIHRKEVA